MKKRNQLFVAFILLAGLSTSAFAQDHASTSGTATGGIIKAISITNYHALAFGSIIPSAAAGTAVMGVTGINVTTNAVNYGGIPVTTNCLAYNTQNAANNFSDPGLSVFEVVGALNETFAITLPSNSVPVYLVNQDINAPNTTVSNFTCVVGNVVGTTGKLSLGTGHQFFAVGGTLNTLPGMAAGNYTGSFTVAVNYN